MKKLIIIFTFILTIILVPLSFAKTGKSNFIKSTKQETLTFVDSVKPITEKQKKKP